MSGGAETIFGSELYGAIVQQQIADAQHTQNQLDKYYQRKEAQLLWLRAEIAHYAAKQDSKSVEYALLSILQRSYDIEDEGGVDQ